MGTCPHHKFHLTDASSLIGFGAYWDGAWFSQPWTDSHSLWGREQTLEGQMPHVSLWQPGSSSCMGIWLVTQLKVKVPGRCPVFVAASNNFHVLNTHIYNVPGIDNYIADSLSRFQLQGAQNIITPYCYMHLATYVHAQRRLNRNQWGGGRQLPTKNLSLTTSQASQIHLYLCVIDYGYRYTKNNQMLPITSIIV